MVRTGKRSYPLLSSANSVLPFDGNLGYLRRFGRPSARF